jgi:hypothetical protein
MSEFLQRLIPSVASMRSQSSILLPLCSQSSILLPLCSQSSILLPLCSQSLTLTFYEIRNLLPRTLLSVIH